MRLLVWVFTCGLSQKKKKSLKVGMSWQDEDVSMRAAAATEQQRQQQQRQQQPLGAEVKLDPTAWTHKRAFNNAWKFISQTLCSWTLTQERINPRVLLLFLFKGGENAQTRKVPPPVGDDVIYLRTQGSDAHSSFRHAETLRISFLECASYSFGKGKSLDPCFRRRLNTGNRKMFELPAKT